MGFEQTAYGLLGAIVLLYLAKLVWTLPGKIWNTIVPRKIAKFFGEKKKFIRRQLDILLYRIFYRKLMDRYKDDEVRFALVCWVRRHLPLTIVCIWWGPGVLLFLHYLSAGGCAFNTTRPYIETCGMCLPALQHNTTWFLKLWDDQASITDHSETPSYYIRTIMISHLPMYNAQLALQDQAVKLGVTLPDGIKDEKVMNSLSKSYVLTYQFSESLLLAFWIRSVYKHSLQPHNSNAQFCFDAMYGERHHDLCASHLRRRVFEDHHYIESWGCEPGVICVLPVGPFVEISQSTVAYSLAT